MVRLRDVLAGVVVLTMTAGLWAQTQVIQRGPFGKPNAVLDETEQWTAPLLVAQDHDVEIYIPDVSSVDWLQKNYPEFHDRARYTITMYTFYRTPEACRTNQINWGLGDQAHLNACALDIRYRVRRIQVDLGAKSVTLQMGAMVNQNGLMGEASVDQGIFRTWDQLDANSQTALEKTNALVTKQMQSYEKKLLSIP